MSQIIRILKYKSKQHIGSMARHNDRKPGHENYYANADSSKTHLNYFVKGSDTSKDAIDRLNELKYKPRKNAVLAVEVLVTASPDQIKNMDKKEQREYFEESVKYLEEKYGKQNITSAVVHLDEESPHMHVSLIPEVDGKLAASRHFDGKKKLEDLWTDFNDKVGSKFGLERNTAELDEMKREKGIEFKQKHVSLRKYYREKAIEARQVIERAQEIIEKKKTEITELSKEQKERLKELTEKEVKQRDLIEKNTVKLNKLNSAGNSKLEAYRKLQKRINGYESRLDGVLKEKEELEAEVIELAKVRDSVSGQAYEQRQKAKEIDSVDELPVVDGIVEHGWIKDTKKPAILVDDVKSFFAKRLNEVRIDAVKEARRAIETDMRAGEHNRQIDAEILNDALKEQNKELRSNVSRLESRVNAYESVMSSEQKNRAESKLSSRLNRNQSMEM